MAKIPCWVPISTGSASNPPTSEGDLPSHVSLWLTPTWSHMCYKLTYLDHLIILLTSIDRFQSPQLNPFDPHSVATSPSFLGLKSPWIPLRLGLGLHRSFTRKPDKLSDMGSFSGPLRSEDHFHLLGSEKCRCKVDGIWVPGNIERWTKKDGFESLEKLVDLSLETIGKLVFQMI